MWVVRFFEWVLREGGNCKLDKGGSRFEQITYGSFRNQEKNPSFIFFILQDSVLRDRGAPFLQKTTVEGAEHDSQEEAMPHLGRDMATAVCE